MSLEAKYRVEQTKWNALASQQLPASSILPPEAGFHDYARGSATLIGVADFLGDLHGKHVLEYGCGLGEVSALLARSGAQVTAFDLSPDSVLVARKRAMLNDVEARVHLAVSAGENLPYADESFDVIFGKAILHHLDVKHGWADLYRVLRTGGKAVFAEPMGMNPVLNFVRARVPYVRKNPRGADCPLNYDEIHAWGKPFRVFHYHEIQLLSMLERGLGFGKPLVLLRRVDSVLLQRMPFLRRYCRYVTMFMEK